MLKWLFTAWPTVKYTHAVFIDQPKHSDNCPCYSVIEVVIVKRCNKALENES